MTNPIDEERSPVDWLRKVNTRGLWKFGGVLVVLGLGVMFAGEVSASERWSTLGIWTMLGGFGLAILAKIISYVELTLELHEKTKLPPNNALEQNARPPASEK